VIALKSITITEAII